jgi:hypothetical protein
VYISHVSHAYYMWRPPHPPWLDHSNIRWWNVQVMKLGCEDPADMNLTAMSCALCCRQNAEPGEPRPVGVPMRGHQHGDALLERPLARGRRNRFPPHQTQSVHLPRPAKGLPPGTRQLLRHRRST